MSEPDGTPAAVSDEMVDATAPILRSLMRSHGAPIGTEAAERWVRDILAAVVPLIRAQVAAEHDAPALIDGLRPKVSQALAATARVDLIWVDPPRVEPRPPVITPAVPGTFAAPVTFAEPDEPMADVQAAFDAGEKGVTKRPLSNREFIAAEVERLGLQPKVDAMWAEVENGPPMPPGWCTWHQMVDCAGAAPECREARAETAGGGDRGA